MLLTAEQAKELLVISRMPVLVAEGFDHETVIQAVRDKCSIPKEIKLKVLPISGFPMPEGPAVLLEIPAVFMAYPEQLSSKLGFKLRFRGVH